MSDNNDKWDYVLAQKTTTTLFADGSGNVCKLLQQLPLPGVIIQVHGVNSDGEWYDEAERGLCAGLNARLARKDSQLCYTGVEAGQMFPTSYRRELDNAGFIDRKLTATTFITPEPNFSPVIRFRWGYKANDEELKLFGPNVWLNEDNYWGGGPFANGCSSLPDLWGDGVNDRLFFWLTAQHMNPVKGRDVYAGPPRAYYVHAAKRLTKLIELIRSKQADVPVTIVCHSQGNMVAMAAAFLGEQLPEVTDRNGKSGKAIADTYVLCNPPYSLRPDKMGFDNWAQRYQGNAQGEYGRQTTQARISTLKHFFNILRERAALEQPHADIDRWCANEKPKDGTTGYKAASDAKDYGLNGTTKGRVTLYCNPADQVISASTVQGIGWLGMSMEQINDTNGKGMFTQRVWAQGHLLPAKKTSNPARSYHYWNDHWKKPKPGSAGFWHPASPPAKFSLAQGLASNSNWIWKLLTVASAPVMYLVTATVKEPVNAMPPNDWSIPLEAPLLPEEFLPTAKSFGKESAADGFDQGTDPAAALRDKNKTGRDPDDPYDQYAGQDREAPQGDATSEAQLRYEDRGRLRMIARRDGKADENGKVEGEAADAQPDLEWVAWRNEKITEFLKDSVDQSATDHSTILTNAANAEKALAYDVAVGYSMMSPEDWMELRIVADWRLVGQLKNGEHPHAKLFMEYFKEGTLSGKRLHKHSEYVPEAMPKTIADERQIKAGSQSRKEEYQHG